MRQFRVAIVGGGGIGSAAAYWVSRRLGAAEQVTCLEQWELGHPWGASEDHSRIIRLGYHSSTYTALTRDAYDAWRTVEEESGARLVHRTGMVNLARSGTEGTRILDAYVAAMAGEDIAFERLGADELTGRWPQFRLDDDVEGLHQPEGGILDIGRASATHVALARSRGAAVVGRAPVTAVRPDPAGVELETPRGPVRAEGVILCAGAWTSGLLAQLGVDWPIRLTQEQVTYFSTPNVAAFAPDRFPVWLWHGEREYYGFPVYGELATKAAEDLGGPEVTLATRSWEADRERVERVADFVEGILPGYSGPELRTRSCLYDMPPDRDFVLDHVPGQDRIAVCIGAGHAAKFASLLGRILSELVLDGGTDAPIEAFRADRPALSDPDFVPGYRLGGTLAQR